MLNKKEWLQLWKKALIDSGYYFFMDVKYVKSQLTECEMRELSPEESAWVHIGIVKELWNMSEDEHKEMAEFITENEGGSGYADKSGG